MDLTTRYRCAACRESSLLAVATRRGGKLICALCASTTPGGGMRSSLTRKPAAPAIGDAGLEPTPAPQVAPMPAAPSAPPQVRVTQCPGYTTDRRYAVADEPVVGGFASLGIGRYLGSDA